MINPARVALTPNMVPASADVYESRLDAVKRMGDLGQIDPSAGSVSELMRDGWLARIGDVEFPVTDFAVQRTDDDQVVLSLVLPVAGLSIGEARPVVDAAEQAKAARLAAVEDTLKWASGVATA